MSIILSEKRSLLIEPLLKWGVLGFLDLYKLSNYRGTYRGFRIIINRMIDSGILMSFEYPLNDTRPARKFVHLSRKAFQLLMPETAQYLDLTIKNHEAVISNILLGFSREKCIGESYLHRKDNFSAANYFNDRIDADGVITAKVEGESYMIAIEAELNRKNSTRIMEKFSRYYSESHYDAAIYFFSNKRIRDAYYCYHQDFLGSVGKSNDESILYFSYSPILDAHNFNPLSSEVIKKSKDEGFLFDFFYKNQNVPSTFPRRSFDVPPTFPAFPAKKENSVSC